MIGEIKFRAWDRAKKEWLAHWNMLDHITIASDGTWGVWEGDDIEFMQFTGLTDKNGVEIYEGDIVFCKGADKGYDAQEVVAFKNGAFAPLARGLTDLDWNFPEFVLADTEVIGNIWENPGLLK